MVQSACIGFCRSSDNKKLGETIDAYISGKINEQELKGYCKKVRIENIKTQKNIGIDIIPSNDFAMYDHMLDATCLVGNIQRRYYWEGGKIPLDIYFALAFGVQKDKFDVVPLKLQNWLNTNYLYHVPEFVSPIEFAYSDNKPIVEYLEAKSFGLETRSTIIGPITYLLQGKSFVDDVKPIDLVEDIMPVYQELFENYKRIGVKSVQIDDPLICLAIDRELKDKYIYCYNELRKYAEDVEIHLTTYYGSLRENFDFISSLPVDLIHIDIPYNIDYVNEYILKLNNSVKISVGIVDARNVWKNNLNKSIDIVSNFCDKIGTENVVIANSSPLFLCPYSLKLEQNIPLKIKHQLAFGVEKLEELEIIKKAINNGKTSVSSELNENKKIFTGHKVYSYTFKKVKKDKTNKNYNSKWMSFAKENHLPNNPMMFLGNADSDIQNSSRVDVFSFGFSGKSYDISDYGKFAKGLFVTENNCIPRAGSDYFNPTIIYDNVEVKKDIFTECVKKAKHNTNKLLKFNVCSPLHFVNFAFVSPFIDINDIYNNVANDMEKCIQGILKEIDILQIIENTFTTHSNLNEIKDIDNIANFCSITDAFISRLKDVKCVALCNSFGNINDFIELVCKIKMDILMLSSIRSGFDILNVFTKYKPEIPIGFGVIDLKSSRITTKNDVVLGIKKMFTGFESGNVVLTTDGEQGVLNDKEKILSSLKNIDSGLKEVYREIEKHKKEVAKENEKNNKKQKKKKKV